MQTKKDIEQYFLIELETLAFDKEYYYEYDGQAGANMEKKLDIYRQIAMHIGLEPDKIDNVVKHGINHFDNNQ